MVTIVYGKDHSKTWSSKGELGVCYLKQKKYFEAEKLLSSAVNFYKNDNYLDLKKLARYTENLAELYNETGHKSKEDFFLIELEKLDDEISVVR